MNCHTIFHNDIYIPTNSTSDVKRWLIGKDPDAGKDWEQEDWKQEEKVVTEDEVVGWHHQLNGYECEQASGIGDGQGSLECCSSWGCKESDTTERLNWTEEQQVKILFGDLTEDCSPRDSLSESLEDVG